MSSTVSATYCGIRNAMRSLYGEGVTRKTRSVAKDRKHGKQGKRGGRTTPKGSRPNHLRAVSGERSPLDDLIESGARELLAEDDPIAAETWASGMLNLFERTSLDARRAGQAVPPFTDALLD